MTFRSLEIARALWLHHHVTRLSLEILFSCDLVPKNTAELPDFCPIFFRKHIHVAGVSPSSFHWAVTRPFRVMEFPRTLRGLTTDPKNRPGNSRLDFLPVSEATGGARSVSSSNGSRLFPRDTLPPEWPGKPRTPRNVLRRGLNRLGSLRESRVSHRANSLNEKEIGRPQTTRGQKPQTPRLLGNRVSPRPPSLGPLITRRFD